MSSPITMSADGTLIRPPLHLVGRSGIRWAITHLVMAVKAAGLALWLILMGLGGGRHKYYLLLSAKIRWIKLVLMTMCNTTKMDKTMRVNSITSKKKFAPTMKTSINYQCNIFCDYNIMFWGRFTFPIKHTFHIKSRLAALSAISLNYILFISPINYH